MESPKSPINEDEDEEKTEEDEDGVSLSRRFRGRSSGETTTASLNSVWRS